jgi:rhodanese-related sulfurtransferase
MGRNTASPVLRFTILSFASLLFGVWSSLALAKGVEFPGRSTYPEVPVISLQDLQARLKDVVVVDVRSSYEYQTLHIKGAVNIPLSGESFIDEMRQLQGKSTKDIVVYCNGKTCMKSYKAARKCANAGINGIVAYDAGIMDWARAYPKQAVLLGESLNDPARLISKERFKKHLLNPDEFGEKMASSSAIVLDVRDRFQRDALAVFPGRERRVYLDQTKKLDRYIDKANKGKRTLLVYDAAGKQVRWLQYYLENKNVRSYYFMEGGARAYFKSMTDEFSK